MDWLRYLRAVEAEAVGDIEEKAKAQRAGVIESKQLSQDDWAAINANLELWKEYYPDGNE